MWVQPLGRENLLQKEIATHTSILAWEIPQTEKPGGLQSMGLNNNNQYTVISYLIHWLRVCCSISINLWVFQFSFYSWFITTFSCGWKRYFIWCLSLMYSYIFFSLEHDMFWKYSMCIWEIGTFVTLWSVQYITVRFCWFVVLFKFSVSLFIFLVVLLLRVGYWCLPNIIVQLFLFISINFCFMFWWLLWAAWKFIILINLCCIEAFINT